MKINATTAKLIAELEYKIGHQCFNPNSYNGYTGDEGCTFRYPVYYTNPEGTEIRTKYRISELKPKNINSLHYRFGSNHLYIGDALVKVLEHIEEQCGIDIAELLKQKKSKK